MGGRKRLQARLCERGKRAKEQKTDRKRIIIASIWLRIMMQFTYPNDLSCSKPRKDRYWPLSHTKDITKYANDPNELITADIL